MKALLFFFAALLLVGLGDAVEMSKAKLRRVASTHKSRTPAAAATTAYSLPWLPRPDGHTLTTIVNWKMAFEQAFGVNADATAFSPPSLHPRPPPFMRSMSLATLKKAQHFFEALVKLHATTPPLVSKYGGGVEPLTIANLNMYHINELLVQPATLQTQTSFAELMHQNNPPTYFVSHYWGGSFVKFVAALDSHKREFAHGLSDDQVFYWVCTFANNQHNAADELGSNFPVDSPFYTAIAAPSTKGVVAVQEDSVASAKWTLSRIWCVFEMQIAKQIGKPVVFACEEGAFLVPGEGSTLPPPFLAPTPPFLTPTHKQCRPELLSLLKGFDPHNAATSSEDDKKKILLYIGKNPACANQQPPVTDGVECLRQSIAALAASPATTPIPQQPAAGLDPARPIERQYSQMWHV